MAVAAKDLTKDYKYGFNDGDEFVFRSERGLSPEVVADISRRKGEPSWMLEFRLKALEHFRQRPMPTWGADLSGIDFDDLAPVDGEEDDGTRLGEPTPCV